jgi:hypothetical protein
MIDLKDASRDDLIWLVVAQHETIQRQEWVIVGQQERIAALEATVAQLTERVNQLLATVAALQADRDGSGARDAGTEASDWQGASGEAAAQRAYAAVCPAADGADPTGDPCARLLPAVWRAAGRWERQAAAGSD